MIEHRTPRAHLQSTSVEADPQEQFPVAPALVEHLDRKFPVSLSPHSSYAAWGAMDGLANTAIDQAEQRGRQQVIDYLRTLSNSPNS